jgi:hypothetical protein
VKNACEPSAEEIQALVDGELSPEAAERVRSALACSERALAELDECLQMAALAHTLRQEATAAARTSPDRADELSRARIIPLVPRPGLSRPRTVIALVASLSLAAAAAVLVLSVMRDAGGPDLRGVDPGAAFASALAPTRPIEARLAWAAADRHRPYDTARAGGGEHPAETISFELLARIEKLGDPRAMTAARVLEGSTARAAQALAAVPAPGHRSPDADSDRAAIALVQGKPEDALLAAAAALESAPHHVQATWNRAVALERLGMPLSAADTFAAVAARGEPGWSQEASERAAGLRAQFERRQAAWKAANEAGAVLVAGGLVDDATVAAYPGLMRLYFYDAVRAAASGERVRALRPLAAALDARFGGPYLVSYVDRIARADFRVRGPLAARYAVLARRGLTDQAEVEALLRALRAAGEKDILLGALLHAADWRPNKTQLAEYLALARDTGDPWFSLEADANRAWIALLVHDPLFAQTVLESAAARCEGKTAIDYQCLDIFRLLTHAYQDLARPDAARRTLDRARQLARATGNVVREAELLWYTQWIAALRDDTSSSLMALSSAYLDEWSRQSADCVDTRHAREWKAVALINQNRLDAARREIAGDTSACNAPFTSGRAFVLAQLLARGGGEAQVRALRHDIAALRASGDPSPGERMFLDHIEGRLLVERTPGEGQALLRRAISAAAALPEDVYAIKARSYSFSVLAEDAATRGASEEALDLLAEDRGLPAPTRCALGAAGEVSSVFVARTADGKVAGARIALRPGEPAGSRPVPDDILAALAGCQSVDVFARKPYYGRPDLLPRDMVWQFRTGAPAREPPPGPGRQIVIANIDPPPGLDLAPLRPLADAPGAILIEGSAATPERVMAAAVDASFLEIHAHGLLGGEESDTSLLVLAPDAQGRYALGGADIRRARLRGAPVVVLAACHASAIGGAFHSPWSLADAFARAGARAVIASPDPIQDAGASAFFTALRARIAAGQPPAAALRAERLARNDPSDQAWIDRLVVFR